MRSNNMGLLYARLGMAMKRKIVNICLLLLMSVLGAGCCAQIPAFPVGAYAAQSLDREFILDFENSGTYSAVVAGDALITDGTYRPAAGTITFSADPPCTHEATYKWILDGETLTFEVSGRDLCPDRREYLQDTIYTCITGT